MNGSIRFLKTAMRLSAALLVTSALAACNPTDTASLSVEFSDGLQEWQLTPPAMLSNRALNLERLSVDVHLNGERINMQQLPGGSASFTGTTQVRVGDNVKLQVEWFERFGDLQLLLSVSEKSYDIDGEFKLTLHEEDYVFDDTETYPLLDIDDDKVTNLNERLEGSNPDNPRDPGDFRADAFISQIDPSLAPKIDGGWDDIYGEGQFRDREGELLYLNNSIGDLDDPDRTDADGNTELRWGGLHDGQYLYLFVLGENEPNRTTHGDSAEPRQDDSIDIFLDGNRSQGRTYDGFDDYHIIIPSVKLGENTRNFSNLYEDVGDEQTLIEGSPDPFGRAELGANSSPIQPVFGGDGFDGLDGVVFATCVCPMSDVYEIRLDLEKLGIPVDESFGFELQINDDADGNTGEYIFAWRSETNDTVRDPSTMGLLKLLPNE